MAASQTDSRSSTHAGTTQFVPVHLHGDLSYAKMRNEEQKAAGNNPVGVQYDAAPQRTEAKQIAYELGIAGLAPIVQRLIDAEEKIKTLVARIDELEKASVPSGLRGVKVERR
jgi:hypothetical protein